MAYIVSGPSLLIFSQNVRDDIVPDNLNSSFLLSQEVPGGSETSLFVFRKKYIIEEIVDFNGNFSLSAVNNSIVTSDQDLAAAFSTIKVGQKAIISGSTLGQNGTYEVQQVDYNGTICELFLGGVFQNETGSMAVSKGYTNGWEVLEPEIDYTVSGVGIEYHKRINFSVIPTVDDQIYVIHRGESTYNFVPSPASVGPEQLQQNLRNFVCDRFTGNGSNTVYTLSQQAVNARTLVVTLDGIAIDGNDPDVAFIGGYDLSNSGLQITFATAPGNGVKIKITHLGFSSVSRRSSLSPGQVGVIPPNSITSVELGPSSVNSSELAVDSVITNKILNDAVTSSKILLDNNQALRSRDSTVGILDIIKIDSTNKTVVEAVSEFLIRMGGNVVSLFTATTFEPFANNIIDLGTSLKRFKDLFIAGVATIQSAVIATLNATNATIGALTVTTLNGNSINSITPVGSILPFAGSVAPAGWGFCDGASYLQATYPALFSIIGTAYGIGGVGEFKVPDLRGRFPLGKSVSGTGSTLAGIGGTLDHTHSVAAHSHGMTPSSTLNVSSSGNHTTSISHSHTGTCTSDGAHSHTVDSTASSRVNIRGSVGVFSNGAVDLKVQGGTDVPSTFGSSEFFSPTVNSLVTTFGGHFHTIAVSSLTADSSSNGAHTHPSSNFSGRIGQVSGGLDGDQTQNSGIANPAFLAINYIIRLV
jgi:microcystin-dependent protein